LLRTTRDSADRARLSKGQCVIASLTCGRLD
jgi:hypothetical protein